jgi:hypothetical protein
VSYQGEIPAQIPKTPGIFDGMFTGVAKGFPPFSNWEDFLSKKSNTA